MLIFGYTREKISETWSCGELYRERLGKYLGIAGVSLSTPVPVANPGGPRVGVAGVELVQILEEEALILSGKILDAEAAFIFREADSLPGHQQAVATRGFGSAFPQHSFARLVDEIKCGR